MMKRFFFLALTLCACTPKPHDLGETLTDGSSGDSDSGDVPDPTTETTGVMACEPPAWFQCDDDICDVLPCGTPLGSIDADGCQRPACQSNDECGPGERCFDIVLAGFCESSSSCEMSGGTCSCFVSDDCQTPTRCVAQADAEAAECPIEGLDCAELGNWSITLIDAYAVKLSAQQFDLAVPIGACSEKVEQAVLDDPNTCGVTPCAEICRLHPCEGYEATCEAQCEQQAASLTTEQLHAIALAAARTPAVCTCDVCTTDTFGFCENVWDCNAGG